MTTSLVRRMKLGSQGLEVSAQGLGCMDMSAFYGPAKPESEMIALIHHAVDSGITFFDTSDMYGPYTNELLLGQALKKENLRNRVELATKFGICVVDGNFEMHGDPAYVRAACEGSLERLQVNCINLYYQHRIDTRVPIEVTPVSTASSGWFLGVEVYHSVNHPSILYGISTTNFLNVVVVGGAVGLTAIFYF